MNLPNKLTTARVIAVPFFILAFYLGYYWVSFALFILASFTDFLDGQIARKNNLVTNFGKIMDPLADKVLVYSAICILIETNDLPAWMLAIILAREFLVAGVRTVAASQGKVIAADLAGKVKTVLQMIGVAGYLFAYAIDIPVVFTVSYAVMVAALVMTVISGFQYTKNNIEVFRS